jgi:hypothetical protein
MLDASVNWELTVWPLMDMANVAVSTLVAGPRSSVRWSEPDFAEYFRAPQSKSVRNRHCFVIIMMSAKYPVQGFNFQCQGPDIFTPGSPRTHICEKGLTLSLHSAPRGRWCEYLEF